MGNGLLAVIKMTIEANDEAACRKTAEQVTAGLQATVQYAGPAEDRPGRWDVVMQAMAPEWQLRDEGSYAVVVTEVLRSLGVSESDSVTVESGPATAWSVVSEVSPAIEWLMVEAWDAEPSSDVPEVEELTGEGVDLSPEELAELVNTLAAVEVSLSAELQGFAHDAVKDVAAELAERLRPMAGYVSVGAFEFDDSNLCRVELRFSVTGDDPLTVVASIVDQFGDRTEYRRDRWALQRDDDAVSALWTGEPLADPALTRLEIRAARS